MHPELAKVAIAFLERAQLQGAEVPAFMAVMKALQELANPPQLPAPEVER